MSTKKNKYLLTSVAGVIHLLLGVFFNWWSTAWVIIPVAAVIEQFITPSTE